MKKVSKLAAAEKPVARNAALGLCGPVPLDGVPKSEPTEPGAASCT